MLATKNRNHPVVDPNNPKPPVWPLPAFINQAPVLLVFDHDDPGVDIAYELLPEGATSPLVLSGDKSAGRCFIPSFTPTFAAREGVVVYAAKHEDGCAIVIDHEDGWMSLYANLRSMFVAPTARRPPRTPARVKTGDVLGYVGSADPGLQTLRFELWRQARDGDYISVDPIRHMRHWGLIPWNDRRFKAGAAAAQAAAQTQAA